VEVSIDGGATWHDAELLNTPQPKSTVRFQYMWNWQGADAVLLMTGYRPDMTLLREAGVPIDPQSGVPAHDPATMATPVPGLYLAGVIAGGNDDNLLFIENTRHHGALIVQDLLARV
jgi:thioredoxin reductase